MDRVSTKLVTDFDGHKKLATFNPNQGKVVIQTVRDEEEYMEHLGAIIQRDYFPSPNSDPLTTPDICNPTDSQRSVTSTKDNSRNPEKNDPGCVSLDQYMANNTTEDDASFAELIEESEKKQRIHLSSFFRSLQAIETAPSDEPKPLALPGGSRVQVGPRLSLTGSNAVHFNPDGVSQTHDEVLNHLSTERRIVPANTRFKRPLPPTVDKRALTKQMVLHKMGHFTLDGKETLSVMNTPQTAGFKFMDASPSPAPSAMGESPLMTWGVLDATPSRIDDSTATPSVISGAPAFRIPSPSKREQLAHKLADKASRQRAKDRNDLSKRVHSGITSPSSRLLLSPAARRLLANSSNILSSSGSRPGTGFSLTCFAQSPSTRPTTTPRRLPSDLGVVRRQTSERTSLNPSTTPTIGDPGSKEPLPTMSAAEPLMDKISSSPSITDNLLNLRATSQISGTESN